MLKLIQSNKLNKTQITKFISVIYKNPLLPTFSQSIIETLAMYLNYLYSSKTFQFEFDKTPNKLEFL